MFGKELKDALSGLGRIAAAMEKRNEIEERRVSLIEKQDGRLESLIDQIKPILDKTMKDVTRMTAFHTGDIPTHADGSGHGPDCDDPDCPFNNPETGIDLN